MQIEYALSSDAKQRLFGKLKSLIAARPGLRVCEIGGGANPLLPLDQVRELALDYTVIDVSATELAKAPADYKKICADVTVDRGTVQGPFDLIISIWCAEHVPDGRAFHRAVYDLLANGGHAVHLFPTLYSPPFVANRLIPEQLSERIVLWMQPQRAPEGDHGKFPARYSWCRGPSRSQIKRFTALGYDVERYDGYFGHSGEVAYGNGRYLDRIPLLCRAREAVSRWLARHPNPWLTTLAMVVLRKGSDAVTTSPPETLDAHPRELVHSEPSRPQRLEI